MAHGHGRGAGVVGFADKTCLPLEQSCNRVDDADMQLLAIQHRPLLDVQFDERVQAVGAPLRVQSVHGVEAVFCHGVDQTHPGEIARRMQAVGRQLAADGLGADHVAEAALFIGEGNRFERETQRNLLLLHATQALQPGQHAQRTIQVAGTRYRVQMRAGHDAGPFAVPVQACMDVGGAIHVQFQTRIPDALLQPLAGLHVRSAEGHAV